LWLPAAFELWSDWSDGLLAEEKESSIMDVSLSTMTTLARNWWAFVVRGIVAIAFGLIAGF
jgi:hypothetical protein